MFAFSPEWTVGYTYISYFSVAIVNPIIDSMAPTVAGALILMSQHCQVCLALTDCILQSVERWVLESQFEALRDQNMVTGYHRHKHTY